MAKRNSDRPASRRRRRRRRWQYHNDIQPRNAISYRDRAQRFPLIDPAGGRVQEFTTTIGVETPRIPVVLFRPLDLVGCILQGGYSVSFKDGLVLPGLRGFRDSPALHYAITRGRTRYRDEPIKVIPNRRSADR